mmetsp:Transcript_2252/g.8191  ORF Transcript_2252/g.8191 Transcript_2252/m.8191 type:complete len:217 (+) Transcript_2252:286-936(+)
MRFPWSKTSAACPPGTSLSGPGRTMVYPSPELRTNASPASLYGSVFALCSSERPAPAHERRMKAGSGVERSALMKWSSARNSPAAAPAAAGDASPSAAAATAAEASSALRCFFAWYTNPTRHTRSGCSSGSPAGSAALGRKKLKGSRTVFHPGLVMKLISYSTSTSFADPSLAAAAAAPPTASAAAAITSAAVAGSGSAAAAGSGSGGSEAAASRV